MLTKHDVYFFHIGQIYLGATRVMTYPRRVASSPPPVSTGYCSCVSSFDRGFRLLATTATLAHNLSGDCPSQATCSTSDQDRLPLLSFLPHVAVLTPD